MCHLSIVLRSGKPYISGDETGTDPIVAALANHYWEETRTSLILGD